LGEGNSRTNYLNCVPCFTGCPVSGSFCLKHPASSSIIQQFFWDVSADPPGILESLGAEAEGGADWDSETAAGAGETFSSWGTGRVTLLHLGTYTEMILETKIDVSWKKSKTLEK
jgi:hypothetical protein